MDISIFGIAGVAAITVICYLIGQGVKASGLDNKWIPVIVGACGGVLNLFMEGFPRPPQLVGNVCGDECRDVLQTFFREVREKNAENTNRSANIVEDFTEF